MLTDLNKLSKNIKWIRAVQLPAKHSPLCFMYSSHPSVNFVFRVWKKYFPLCKWQDEVHWVCRAICEASSRRQFPCESKPAFLVNVKCPYLPLVPDEVREPEVMLSWWWQVSSLLVAAEVRKNKLKSNLQSFFRSTQELLTKLSVLWKLLELSTQWAVCQDIQVLPIADFSCM